MSSLEEQLKRIRQARVGSNSKAGTALPTQLAPGIRTPPPTSVLAAAPTQDEVHDLLRQTAEEVSLEYKHTKNEHRRDDEKDEEEEGGEDFEAWLNGDAGEEEAFPPPGNDTNLAMQDVVINSKVMRELADDADKRTREAKTALAELRKDMPYIKASNLLQLDPKERPVLSRVCSTRSGAVVDEPESKSLEIDLADAMGGNFRSTFQVAETEHQAPETEPESDEEVDQLSHRLAQLHSTPLTLQGGLTAGDVSSITSDDPLIDLPSAPSTQPVNTRKASSLFSKAGQIDPPVVPVDESEEWCCICNEDAVLSCLGCDQDLYCRKCWSQGHLHMDREELTEHPTRMFIQQRRKPVAAAAI